MINLSFHFPNLLIRTSLLAGDERGERLVGERIREPSGKSELGRDDIDISNGDASSVDGGLRFRSSPI